MGEDGELKNRALPSLALFHAYWLSDKRAIGVQTDLFVESFFIEHGGEELLEREYAEEQTRTATRLGVEYGSHLGAEWEMGIAATWDMNWIYYDAWGLNFTVSRLFGGGHRGPAGSSNVERARSCAPFRLCDRQDSNL